MTKPNPNKKFPEIFSKGLWDEPGTLEFCMVIAISDNTPGFSLKYACPINPPTFSISIKFTFFI